MPDSTISALTAAAVLDGTEAIPVAQLTSTVRTTTQAIANLASATSAKINTVSNTLSNLISLHDILSNRVSANSAVGGSGSVTSNELSAAVKVSAVSAATSVQGLQSVVNQLSNHISVLSQAVSVVEVHASAASAAATSADAHANAASAAATSADSHANTASAAATSVDTRVNTVSNTVSQHTVSLAQLSNAVSLLNNVSTKSAATSVKGLQSVINQLSNRISAGGTGFTASARTTAAASIQGAQSVVDALSNRISAAGAAPGGISVTSNELSAAVKVSAVSAATSVQGLQSVVNQLSNHISVLSQAISVLEVHASTASAAATSVDTRVNTVSNLVSQHTVSLAALSNLISGVSAKSVGVSVKGLQSALGALSNTISTVSAAVTSVDTHANTASAAATSADGHANTASAAATSADAHANAASAAATSVDTRVNTVSNTVSQHTVSLAQLSNAVSLLNNVSTASAATSVKGLQSVIVQISNRLSAISAAATSVDTRVNTVSNTVSQHTVSLAQLSNATSLLNNVSAVSAATSVKGLQSVINQMSNRISAIVLGGGGMTSDQASAMIHSVLTTQYSARTSIGGATSTKGLQSALDDLSLQISSLNSVVSNALSAGDVISATIVSVQSTVSHLASIVSLVSTVSAAGTAVGLQSVINALSARIVAGASATSAEVQTASAAATSVDQRVTSVNNLWTSGLGTNVVLGKCTNGHAMTPGASFTNVSGCAVALVANGDYQIDGRVFFSLSIVTGTRFGFSYNTTGNGQMVKGAMDMRCATSVIAAAISNMVSTNWSYGHINEAQMSNAATANISITGISATTYMLEIEGMLQNGNSAVTLNLQAAHSAAGGGINILAGSFIRAYRIV